MALILADHHNPEENCAYPEVPRLARMALMSKRHAQDVLKSMEHKQFLRIARGNGRGRRSEYYLLTVPPEPSKNKTKGAPPAPFPKGKNLPKRVQKGCTAAPERVQKGCTDEQRNKEEPIEPKKQPAATAASPLPPVFDLVKASEILLDACPSMNQAMINRIVHDSLRAQPSLHTEEFAYVVRDFAGRQGIRNLAGLLASQLAESFVGEPFKRVRLIVTAQELRARVRQQARDEYLAWREKYQADHSDAEWIETADIPAHLRQAAHEIEDEERQNRK